MTGADPGMSAEWLFQQRLAQVAPLPVAPAPTVTTPVTPGGQLMPAPIILNPNAPQNKQPQPGYELAPYTPPEITIPTITPKPVESPGTVQGAGRSSVTGTLQPTTSSPVTAPAPTNIAVLNQGLSQISQTLRLELLSPAAQLKINQYADQSMGLNTQYALGLQTPGDGNHLALVGSLKDLIGLFSQANNAQFFTPMLNSDASVALKGLQQRYKQALNTEAGQVALNHTRAELKQLEAASAPGYQSFKQLYPNLSLSTVVDRSNSFKNGAMVNQRSDAEGAGLDKPYVFEFNYPVSFSHGKTRDVAVNLVGSLSDLGPFIAAGGYSWLQAQGFQPKAGADLTPEKLIGKYQTAKADSGLIRDSGALTGASAGALERANWKRAYEEAQAAFRQFQQNRLGRWDTQQALQKLRNQFAHPLERQLFDRLVSGAAFSPEVAGLMQQLAGTGPVSATAGSGSGSSAGGQPFRPLEGADISGGVFSWLQKSRQQEQDLDEGDQQAVLQLKQKVFEAVFDWFASASNDEKRLIIRRLIEVSQIGQSSPPQATDVDQRTLSDGIIQHDKPEEVLLLMTQLSDAELVIEKAPALFDTIRRTMGRDRTNSAVIAAAFGHWALSLTEYDQAWAAMSSPQATSSESDWERPTAKQWRQQLNQAGVTVFLSNGMESMNESAPTIDQMLRILLGDSSKNMQGAAILQTMYAKLKTEYPHIPENVLQENFFAFLVYAPRKHVFPDLSAADRLYADFNRNQGDFKNQNFSGIWLVHADLRGMDFTGADFTGASLQFANFSNANLSHANLKGATLLFTQLPKQAHQKEGLRQDNKLVQFLRDFMLVTAEMGEVFFDRVSSNSD